MSRPSWVMPTMIVMGACTPGGLLFLVALLTQTNINLEPVIWLVLAAGGGLGGWRLAKTL